MIHFKGSQVLEGKVHTTVSTAETKFKQEVRRVRERLVLSEGDVEACLPALTRLRSHMAHLPGSPEPSLSLLLLCSDAPIPRPWRIPRTVRIQSTLTAPLTCLLLPAVSSWLGGVDLSIFRALFSRCFSKPLVALGPGPAALVLPACVRSSPYHAFNKPRDRVAMVPRPGPPFSHP